MTPEQLHKAYLRASRAMKCEQCTSSASSAGFVLTGKRGEKQGVQVFVKIIRYSDKKLKKNRNSGGLATRP